MHSPGPFLRKVGKYLSGLIVLASSPAVFAWGPMHASITAGAFNALPQWQQELLAQSELITGKDPAQKVSLLVWRAREITIQVESQQSVTPGKNYAVIGKPTLWKAQGTPKLDQDKVP